MKENTRYKTVQHFHSHSKSNQQERYLRLTKLDHKRKYLTPQIKLNTPINNQSFYFSNSSKNKKNIKQRQTISKIMNDNMCNQQDILVQKHEIRKRLNIEQDQQQKEIYNANKEYLMECQNVRKYKEQFYQTMRSRLVKKFPAMQKVYKQKNIQVAEYIEPIRIQLSAKKSQASLRYSKSSSFENQKSWIRTTIENHLKQIPQKRKKINVQQTQKKSYFYSKSKKRCMTAFNPYEQTESQIKKQEFFDFNYLSYQKNRQPFKKSKRIKDIEPMQKASKIRRLLKNQHSILDIEKQGTPQFQILKKSFQQSIQRQQL